MHSDDKNDQVTKQISSFLVAPVPKKNEEINKLTVRKSNQEE